MSLDSNIKFDIEQDKTELSRKLKEYVNVILEEYKEVISVDIKEWLMSITNYEELIKIEETGTISLYVSNGKVFLPIDAYRAIDELSKRDGFGSKKNHITYNETNMIINDNTFLTFVEHVFLKGMTPKDYFSEILLHEVMHLCGSSGANALGEGFNELKTRELALKYNLETSCCGYPKEVMIAYRLQEIFGKELCDKLTFCNSLEDRFNLLLGSVGATGAQLYLNVFDEMEKQFSSYRGKKFPGVEGIKNKCEEYDKIDYFGVYRMIDEFRGGLDESVNG